MRVRNASTTQQRILEHGRAQFAAHGYAATTVAGVARAAGVSPNLVTRYFGGKNGLFLAATEVEIAVTNSFDGDLAGLGDRLAANITARWFDVTGEDPMLVLHRASGEKPDAAEALAAFLDAHSLEPLYRYLLDRGLNDQEAQGRAAAIDAFVLGVGTRRRVLRSALGKRDEFQVWLAGSIQRLANG